MLAFATSRQWVKKPGHTHCRDTSSIPKNGRGSRHMLSHKRTRGLDHQDKTIHGCAPVILGILHTLGPFSDEKAYHY